MSKLKDIFKDNLQALEKTCKSHTA